MLILGDNIFYGQGLPGRPHAASAQTQGATVFAYHVRDPERYGVVTFDEGGRATSKSEYGQYLTRVLVEPVGGA